MVIEIELAFEKYKWSVTINSRSLSLFLANTKLAPPFELTQWSNWVLPRHRSWGVCLLGVGMTYERYGEI